MSGDLEQKKANSPDLEAGFLARAERSTPARPARHVLSGGFSRSTKAVTAFSALTIPYSLKSVPCLPVRNSHGNSRPET
jgi:hypothetical protein